MKKVINWFSKFFKPSKYSEKVITICIILLCSVGFLYMTSASINSATTIKSTMLSMAKQIFILVISFGLYNYLSNNFDLDKCRKSILFVLIFEFILLVVAYVYCKLTGSINGNYSWITLNLIFFEFGVQPSEFSKGIMVIAIACLLADRKLKSDKSFRYAFGTFVVFLSLYLIVILILQGDMGSCVILFLVSALTFLMLDNERLKKYQIFVVVLLLLSVVFAVACLFNESARSILGKISSTFAARFSAVTNPDYSNDATREIFYSLLGISNGGLLGVGFGNSIQKFGYLVSSDADYIFAVMVEESGILAVILVFGLYIALISFLLYYSKKMIKEADRIIILGTVFILLLHFVLNVGGVTGLLPLTGVPLLLLSRGGSSTMAIMMMLGICQNRIHNYHLDRKKNSGFAY